MWVTDAVATNRIPKGDKRGHIVVKFSPAGKVLMTLGTPGTEGSGPDHFTSPSDVAVAAERRRVRGRWPRRDRQQPHREVLEGGRVRQGVGQDRLGPGEFRSIHAIAMDSRGRVFVGDRGNNRIQIFDQDGKSLSTPWTQFGKPSGITFDAKDQIYVADSESDDVQNPGWEEGHPHR